LSSHIHVFKKAEEWNTGTVGRADWSLDVGSGFFFKRKLQWDFFYRVIVISVVNPLESSGGRKREREKKQNITIYLSLQPPTSSSI
jgi:hypothetical protein